MPSLCSSPALLVLTAVRKLGHVDAVVATYRRVGVPEDKLNYLAYTLLAGATGLVAGIWWPPIGVIAATALIVYFVLAIGAHLRSRDSRNAPTPLLYLALAVATLILQLA